MSATQEDPINASLTASFEKMLGGRYSLDTKKDSLGGTVYKDRWVQGAWVAWRAAHRLKPQPAGYTRADKWCDPMRTISADEYTALVAQGMGGSYRPYYFDAPEAEEWERLAKEARRNALAAEEKLRAVTAERDRAVQACELLAAQLPNKEDVAAWVPPMFFEKGCVALTARRKKPPATVTELRGEYIPLYRLPEPKEKTS